MTGSPWVDWPAAATFAALAAVALVRLVMRRDTAGRLDAAACAAMAAGMAAMAVPAGSRLPTGPAEAWITIFAAAGPAGVGALAGSWARTGASAGPVRGPGPPPAGTAAGRRLACLGAAHHVAASALMIALLAGAGHGGHQALPGDDRHGAQGPGDAHDLHSHQDHLVRDHHAHHGNAGATPAPERRSASGTPRSAGVADAATPAAGGQVGGQPARTVSLAAEVPGPAVAVAGAGFLAHAAWLVTGLARSTRPTATGCACAVRARRPDAAAAALMSAGMALMAFTMA
ncbi:MAG TPA: hypothetical protein VIL48_19290 [Acidimicrobiales bacterium]